MVAEFRFPPVAPESCRLQDRATVADRALKSLGVVHSSTAKRRDAY